MQQNASTQIARVARTYDADRNIGVPPVHKYAIYPTLYLFVINHSLSRYNGLETKQKSLCYVFVSVHVELCTVTVIELIVFSYNIMK